MLVLSIYNYFLFFLKKFQISLDQDLKRASFRQYLQKTGVTDCITKAFVSLYEEQEKPSNAIEYIGKFFNEENNKKILELQQQIDDLKRENQELKKKLEQE